MSRSRADRVAPTAASSSAAANAAPAARRTRRASTGAAPRRSRAQVVTIKVVAFLVIAAVWELVVAVAGQDFMATPTGVLAALPGELVGEDTLWAAAWETLRLVLLGLAIAVVVGVSAGLAMGRIAWVQAAFSPYLNGVYATPMIAILPILTLWLGFTTSATFALVVYAAVPPMAVAAWDGSRTIQARYLEVARTFGARRRDVWLGIALPASLPSLLAGLRLASGRALSAAVIAEFLIGTGNGLGIHVIRLAGQFRHDEAVVAILLLAAFGLVFTVGIERVVGRLLPWFRPSR